MSLIEARARHQWAHETFGGVEAGDRRRNRRVVAVAQGVAARPAGTVTEVFGDSADREGAYRLLANDALPAKTLTKAMCEATARQCAAHRVIYVPVDGSSLSLIDRKGARELGGVGAWKDYGRGLHMVTALALNAAGVPLGVLAQTWWTRSERSPERRSNVRKLAEKETRFLVGTLQDAVARVGDQCPQTLAVTVMDRGFDCWPVLHTAGQGAHFILRAEYNRRLADGPRGQRRYLQQELRSQPARGSYQVHVPQRPGRPARTAQMLVRTLRVSVVLRVGRKRRESVDLHAVLAQEKGGPKGASLSWMLLTTEPVDTFAQAVQVVRGYTFRWRIEEMHRAWKRGGCNVEDTQLRSLEAILKWATLHCAVATRAVRLTQLARVRPDAPSSEEFSQTEIDAAIALRRKRTKFKLGDVPPLVDVVRLIADLGGYTGKSSGGPPGPTVIARGLERVGIAAEVLEAMHKK
jgi:Transposase DNA-binding/Transposase DDE domain